MTNVPKSKKRYLLWASEIYIITVAIVVVSAWLSNMHPYELNLTVSKYIGLQFWTSVLYLIMSIFMCLMISIYLFKTRIRPIRKLVYFFIVLQILGCAYFPSVSKKLNSISAATHKEFAYSLVFGIALSFFVMLIWGINIQQRLYAIIGLLYAFWFAFCYMNKIPFFKSTIFIWENLIIFLFFLELSLEDESTDGKLV